MNSSTQLDFTAFDYLAHYSVAFPDTDRKTAVVRVPLASRKWDSANGEARDHQQYVSQHVYPIEVARVYLNLYDNEQPVDAEFNSIDELMRWLRVQDAVD